jgi:hypothetical protein
MIERGVEIEVHGHSLLVEAMIDAEKTVAVIIVTSMIVHLSHTMVEVIYLASSTTSAVHPRHTPVVETAVMSQSRAHQQALGVDETSLHLLLVHLGRCSSHGRHLGRPLRTPIMVD